MPNLVANIWFFVARTLAIGKFGAFVLKAGALILLNVLVSKLFGPKIPSSQQSLGSVSIMTRSATEYRKVVYGTAPVSGPVVYHNVDGGAREYLWCVVARADGEVEEFVSVWLDGDEIDDSEITWSPGTGGADGTCTGVVTLGKWIGANSTNAVEIYYALGHDDQVAMSKLTDEFTTDWGISHRLRGVAYVTVKLLYN